MNFNSGRAFRQWLGLAAIVLVWEAYGRSASPLFVSYPSEVVLALLDMAVSGELIDAASVALWELFIGFTAAILLSVSLGLAMGGIRWVDDVMSPVVLGLYATPRIAFIPVLILWFGIGVSAKVSLIILLAVFPMIIAIADGTRRLITETSELIIAFGGSKLDVIRVVLPGIGPTVILGMKLGIGLAIVGMVLGEMFTSLSGFGEILVVSASRFQMDRVFGIVIVLGVFGWGLTAVIEAIGRLLFPWSRVW